jgi:hypothetical protein
MADFLDDCWGNSFKSRSRERACFRNEAVIECWRRERQASQPHRLPQGDRSQGFQCTGLPHDGHGAAPEVLIEAGANSEALSFYHRTALHLIPHYDFGSVVRQLVQRDAIKEAGRGTNEIPLPFTVESNHIDIVVGLVDLGFDIEAQGVRGTPLHVAATLDHHNVVRQLLEKDEHLDAKMHNGQTRCAALLQRVIMQSYNCCYGLTGGDTQWALAEKSKHKYVIDL